jgi:hypothetical protein
MTSIQDFMQTAPFVQIVNCDEIAWLLHPDGIVT